MKKKKILMIDDEEGFVRMAKINVEKAGPYEVDTARDAAEGLEKIRERSYQVIFLDVLMPKVEGREALEEIKKICDTPVVIMSAYLPPHQQKEVTRIGAFAVLEKPLDVDQVVAMIEKACRLETGGSGAASE